MKHSEFLERLNEGLMVKNGQMHIIDEKANIDWEARQRFLEQFTQTCTVDDVELGIKPIVMAQTSHLDVLWTISVLFFNESGYHAIPEDQHSEQQSAAASILVSRLTRMEEQDEDIGEVFQSLGITMEIDDGH